MKRSLTIITLILMTIVGITFFAFPTGSLYFVVPAGTPGNTPAAPYDTPGNAANLPATVITYIKGLGSPGPADVISIAAGAYSGTGNIIRLDNSKLAGLTIQGAGSGTTSLTSTNSNTVVVTTGCGDYVSINGLSLYGSINRVLSIGVAINVGLNDIDVWQTGSGASLQTAYFNSATLAINKFRTFFTTGQSVYCDGTTNGTIQNFLNIANNYTGGVAAANGSWQFANTGGTINLNNGDILDSAGNGLTISGAGGTVNGKNVVIQGGALSASAYAVQRTAGTLTLEKCMLIGPDNTHITTGTMTLTNCYSGYAPGFQGATRGGYIVPSVDQCSNNLTTAGYGYIKSIASILSAKGMKGTWFIDPIRVNLADHATTDQLKNFLLGNSSEGISAGVIELGSLGRCHSNMTYAHALNFSHTGGSNPTYAFDGTTFTLTATGGDYTVTFATTPGTSTLTDAITAMNGQKGWTVAKSTTGGQLATSIDNYVLTTSLSTITATAAPGDIDFNRDATLAAGYLKDEITGGKALMESIVGSTIDPQTGATYACVSNGAPYNVVDTTTTTGFSNGGYWGARGSGRQELHAVQAFSLPFCVATTANEATTRLIARSLGFQASQSGLIWIIEAHTTSDWSTDQWTWAADEWSKIAGLKVTSMQLAMKDIRTSGLWADGGVGVWTRTYTLTNTSNLTPAGGGNLFNTGVAIGAGRLTDYAGKQVPNIAGGTSIGAYEFWQWESPLGLGPTPGLGGFPGWH